jgi:hypothetical protein
VQKYTARAAFLEPGGALFTYSYIISARQCANGGAYDVSAHPSFYELEPAAAPAPTPKAAPKVSWLQHLEFPVRVALHMAFASLWVAVPSWQRRADGYGSWVGISVMCVVQESLGATFTKMFQRLFGNASAGAAAMTIALVLSVDHLIWAAALVSAWIFLCLVWFEPTMAYLQECAAFSAVWKSNFDRPTPSMQYFHTGSRRRCSFLAGWWTTASTRPT